MCVSVYMCARFVHFLFQERASCFPTWLPIADVTAAAAIVWFFFLLSYETCFIDFL